MKKSFDEVKTIKLEDGDRASLSALSRNRDFKRLKQIVEDYILQLTHNIAVGIVVSKEARYEEMDKLAGFAFFWKKVVDLVENEEHHRKDVEITEK